MNIDEYRKEVIRLLKTQDQDVLEDAANCVLYCSESGVEPSQHIDLMLGYLDTES